MVKTDRKKPKLALDLPNYSFAKKVGEGTYGVVWRATNRLTDATVALKCIKLEGETQGFPSTTIREISFLKSLSHPNIIQLHDVIPTRTYLYLVFEFMDKDLRSVIEADDGSFIDLPPATIKSYSYQMLLGIEYCHSRQIMHRDLKPQNVLVDRNGTVKLADFGLARAVTLPLRAYTHEVVTLWYRAPEILLGAKRYCFAVDMWSFGCMCAEMVARRTMFRGDAEIDQLFRIFRVLGTPSETVWPDVSNLPYFQAVFPRWSASQRGAVRAELEAARGSAACLERALNGSQQVNFIVDLLEELFIYPPASRMTAQGALRHAYFDDLRGSVPALPVCSNETTLRSRYSLPNRTAVTQQSSLAADANCNFPPNFHFSNNTSTNPNTFVVPLRTALAIPPNSAITTTRPDTIDGSTATGYCNAPAMTYINPFTNSSSNNTICAQPQPQQRVSLGRINEDWSAMHSRMHFGSSNDLNAPHIPFADDFITPVTSHPANRDAARFDMSANDTSIASQSHVSTLQSRIVLMPTASSGRQLMQPGQYLLDAPSISTNDTTLEANDTSYAHFTVQQQPTMAHSRKRPHEQINMCGPLPSRMYLTAHSRASLPFVGSTFDSSQSVTNSLGPAQYGVAYGSLQNDSDLSVPPKLRRV